MGRKPKQTMIEGTEPESIPEIEEAAEAYVTVRDHRMSLTDDEVEAQKKLREVMQKHGLEKYEFDHQMVTVVPAEVKVKVKKLPAPKLDADEE